MSGLWSQVLYRSKALPTNVKGALFAICGAFAFSAMGALIRVLAFELPTITILFFRVAFSLPILLGWMLLSGRLARVQTSLLGWHFARAAAGLASLACLIQAYRSLDFALATALAFTTPLWVIILSVIFIGERPGWRRSAATALGFVGVLVIVRPLPLWEIGVWAALASAVFGAAALAFLRHLTRLESTETLLLYFFLFGFLISVGPTLYIGYRPDLMQLALLLAAALTGLVGLSCASNAYAVADATVVAPFDFARLPLAALIGLVIFAEVPDPWLIVGVAVMIVALYIIVVFGRRAPAIDPATGGGYLPRGADRSSIPADTTPTRPTAPPVTKKGENIMPDSSPKERAPCIRKRDDIRSHDRGAGVVTQLFCNQGLCGAAVTTGTTVLPTGKSVAMHWHNCDEQIVILSGQAEAEFLGVRTPISEMEVAFIPAGEPHCFHNVGDTPVTMLFIYDAGEVTRTFAATGETVGHLDEKDLAQPGPRE